MKIKAPFLMQYVPYQRKDSTAKHMLLSLLGASYHGQTTYWLGAKPYPGVTRWPGCHNTIREALER